MYFKKQIFIAHILIILFSFVGLFFISCSATAAIFATVENEEKIESGNLDDNITALGMALVGENYFVATGGAIFYRKKTTSVWDELTLPSGYDGASKLVETEQGQEAYAVLVKDYAVSPSEYAVYKLSAGGSSVVDFQKIRSSTEFTDIFAVSDKVGLITTGAPKNLFAYVGEFSASAVNSVQYYQNYETTSPNLLSLDTAAVAGGSTDRHSSIIVDIAYNNVANTYYLANESNLYTVSGNTLQRLDYSTSTPYGYIGGIYYSPQNSLLYVSNGRFSDRGGYVRTYDSATSTWLDSGKQEFRFFTKFIDIDQVSFTGVLVGTAYKKQAYGRDEGYFEMDGSRLSFTTPSGNKYTSGKLDVAGVRGFYVGENIFFVLTNSLGLWQGNYNSGKSIDWYLE